MRFTLGINMARHSPSVDTREVSDHTLEMVQMADAGGFDIVWAGEHHAIESFIAPNPFTQLAWWGAKTSQIRLGTAVIVAPYWHPIRLAGEAALLDLYSGGRLEFGIGRGAYQREFDRMMGGVDQKLGGAYMREMLPLLRGLWQGDVEAKGEFWQFPTSTSCPKPLQNPLPVWVAARDPDSYDWGVSNGCNIQSWAMVRPFAEVESYKSLFDNALKKYPQRHRPKFLTMRHTCVFNRADQWEAPVSAVIDHSRRFENLFKNLGGVTNGFVEDVSLDAVPNRSEYDPAEIRKNLIFGTPDEVIAKLKPYEALGVDYFNLAVSFGMPFAEQKKSLRLFIDEVMPAFTRSAVKATAAE